MDPLALPENDVPVGQQGWDPSAELIGSRTESAKTYLGEDGERVTLLAAGPVHYLEDGSWEDIDLNMVSTAEGWEVTKNTFETQFSDDTGAGISVQVHPNVDPIRFGVNPIPMFFMGEDFNPMPYMDTPSQEGIETGANVIRYPLTDNAEVDYQVSQIGVKQTLNLRDMPTVPDGFEGHFGLQETMILPSGYALFIGDAMVEDANGVDDTYTALNAYWTPDGFPSISAGYEWGDDGSAASTADEQTSYFVGVQSDFGPGTIGAALGTKTPTAEGSSEPIGRRGCNGAPRISPQACLSPVRLPSWSPLSQGTRLPESTRRHPSPPQLTLAECCCTRPE